MRCPYCKNSGAKVVDSRESAGGAAIRRRRQCLACGSRFTTFERIEGLPLRVRKRSGVVEPYEREKVIAGIRKACTNRPVSEEQIHAAADALEAVVAERRGREISSQDLGLTVLDQIRHVDDVAYVRFASVYKDFQEVSDFEREVGLLLQKKTPPKSGPVPTMPAV
ncbi:MAG: transcriptional regulator NrdR [Actinomycetota bacterium]